MRRTSRAPAPFARQVDPAAEEAARKAEEERLRLEEEPAREDMRSRSSVVTRNYIPCVFIEF